MKSIDASREGFSGRFDWCRDSMIKSYFEGIYGTAMAGGSWAAVRAGDFLYCAGQPEDISELCGYIRTQMDGNAVIVPEQAEGWLAALNGERLPFKPISRFHTKLPEGGFDIEALKRMTESVSGCGCLRLVQAGETEYPLLRDCPWENSFVAHFNGMEDFLKNGLACCLYVGDELASATSTYGYYSGGYEIQIATAPKFRRRGYAQITGAAFLLETLRRGKIPHWDAAHAGSQRLAARLGFIPDGEYTALAFKEH